MAAITHALVSAIATDPAATAAGKVTPTNWNANHVITSTAGLALLANLTGAGGVMTEATISQVLDAQDGAAAQGDLLYRNGTVWAALATGTKGKLLTAGGAAANPSWTGPNYAYTVYGAPGNTTNTTGVMLGLAGALTPAGSGIVKVYVAGDGNQAAGADGGKIFIRWGTGAAPAVGSALAGTALGFGRECLTFSVDGNKTIPLSDSAVITGLTPGVAIWVDVSIASISGGTFAYNNVTLVLEELR